MERYITSIEKVGDNISIIFNDLESAIFYKFGKDVYTTTSEKVLKKTLSEFKKDLKRFDFDVEKLRDIWIKN